MSPDWGSVLILVSMMWAGVVVFWMARYYETPNDELKKQISDLNAKMNALQLKSGFQR